MRLHVEEQLVALLGLVHLGVAFAVHFLGRARRSNEGGVNDGASLEQQALLRQTGVDGALHLGRKLTLLQHVANEQDGGLVGHACGAVQADEAAAKRLLLKFLFAGRDNQVPPELRAVDAQHGLNGERRVISDRLVRNAGVGLDEGDQRGAEHDLVHLGEEDFPAGLLGQRLKA